MDDKNNTFEFNNKINLDFKKNTLTDNLEQEQAENITKIIEECLEKVKRDPGAPYETKVINALKILSEQSPAEYMRYRNNFKKSNMNVSVTKLDKLIKSDTQTTSQEMRNTERLIIIIREQSELFHNKNNESFATFKNGEHYETWVLESKGFKRLGKPYLL